jgi:hypothetical protein
MTSRLALTLMVLACSTPAWAETVQPDRRWVWSENAAWMDARPLGGGGPGLHADDGVVSGWLYAANVGWVSANCLNTGSCAEVPYGLRLEEIPQQPGRLRLTGHLWSENAGWIVAHCLSTSSCTDTHYGLEVDLLSGQVEGLAWSENLGWINFSCSSMASCAQVDFGLGFLPQVVVPVASELFADGFES